LTVLVTGGAGFIGSHLVESLLARGDRVVCLDNFDPFYDPAVKRRNLAGVQAHASFSLVEGDVRDVDLLTEVLTREAVERIVHLAARAGVQPSRVDPLGYQDVNVRGTVAALEAARRAGVRHFVFGSSSTVYGDTTPVPFSEDAPAVGQLVPYGASKRAAELFAYTYHRLYDLPVTCLRFFSVHGPRLRPDLAIHLFTRKIDRGETITLYGDQARDCTYITDIVEGVVAAIDRPFPFEIINLGDSSPVRVSEMVSIIEACLGKSAVINRAPPRPGDAPETYADITKARKLLGFEPRVPLAEGIAHFVEWYRAQP
jgi:UDP-glucuronate 4-epimerase